MITGIVSCDPGGAEMLSSFVSLNKKRKFIFYLKGQAKYIFSRKNIKFNNIKKIFFFDNVDEVILTSGWSTNFEIKNLIQAKKLKKKTVVLLDHWSNYKERFLYKKKIYLPDIIWVVDLKAKKKIQEIFPSAKVVLKKNYYFEYLKKIKLKKSIKKNCILYICDPKSKKISGYNEKDSFNFFMKNIHKIVKLHNFKLTIRKHPLQKKIQNFFFKYKNINFSKSKDILEDISKNDIIVGSGSMGLITATFFKKKVFSSVPPGAKFLLPSKKIKLIREIN